MVEIKKNRITATHFLSIVIFLCFTPNMYAQNVGVNATGTPPDASAMLDVSSNSKGFLVPRIALTGTTDVTTIPVAATSLLIYNTATITDVTPGYYYWNGTLWIRMLEGGTNDFWKTTGNAGTTVGTNFIGTTDAQDVAIYTNNTEKIRVTSSGDVGIGVGTPTAKLEVAGQVKITGGAPGLGKVLTSDATGLGTWQPASPSLASSQVTSATQTTSTSFAWVDLAGMITSVTTSGGNLFLTFTASAAHGTGGGVIAFRFLVDGVPVTFANYGNINSQTSPGVGAFYQKSISANWLATGVSAGTHIIKVQWRLGVIAGTILCTETVEESNRTLVVIEI